MNSVFSRDNASESPHWLGIAGRGALRVTWHAIRLPALTLLVVMEPLICRALTLLAILGVLTACFWEFFARQSHFPFWTVLGISVGVGMLQIPYYLLIRLFSKH
jgi:hypothetical protein